MKACAFQLLPQAVAIPLVGLLLIARLAAASEQSERLYSRGLVEFHAGRYAEALQLFDQAVQTDPQDVYARFYRGLTHDRLNNRGAAIADLREVLAQKPDFDHAALELGVALLQSGSFQEAQAWLRQAQRLSGLEGRASLFLGIAHLREAQLDQARQNFQRAAKSDPSLEVTARYYQGVVDYRESRFSEAQEHFSYVATTSPNTDIGREAGAFLATIRQGAHFATRLYAAVGFQYDSNVVLAPSDDVVKSQFGISNQADGSATLTAGGVYAPWRTEQAELGLGYDFYQTLHFELSSFNIQDHRFNAQAIANVGPAQLGLQGRYDYYFLETDSYLQEAVALPWLTVPEGSLGRTEVFYRMRRRDFLQQAFHVRDAFNHSPGLQQFFYLGNAERYIMAGYRFDREDPVQNTPIANSFAYDGNEFSTGIGWDFPLEVSGELDYLYRNEQYAQPSTADLPAGARRRDDVHQVLAVVRKRLSEHLVLVGGYFGTINDSTKTAFDYQRHIGLLSLEVGF